MVRFCRDVDILRYEPVLFGELHLRSQVTASGEGGVLNGTSFSAAGADFIAARVEAGGVIYLRSADGSVDGAYEIVSVDSATELTVSVLRADREGDAVAPPSAGEVSYRICTYGPQAAEIGFALTEYLGIAPGAVDSDISADDILDTSALGRASAFGVIAAVYAMLGSRAEDENYWRKSLYYRRLFEKARERCRVGIDLGADGVADVTRVGGSVRLKRD